MKILFYDKKRFADITDEESQTIQDAKGTHILFKGNYLKNNQIEIFNEQKEGGNEIWQKSTEELKEIIGEFENQIKEHKENIPPTIQGQFKAVADGKLPNCGTHWLFDRGVVAYYLKNGWLQTIKIENEKRSWAMTQKYVEDGIPQKEEALSELIGRRQFAEEECINQGDIIIKDLYEKGKKEKIMKLRQWLSVRLGWE